MSWEACLWQQGRTLLDGGGRAYLFVACLGYLTAHPFRDGAPFLLLIDTSNIWALVAFLHMYNFHLTRQRHTAIIGYRPSAKYFFFFPYLMITHCRVCCEGTDGGGEWLRRRVHLYGHQHVGEPTVLQGAGLVQGRNHALREVPLC